MKRKIYLEGEIGAKFGNEFTANVSSIRDVFRLLEANHPQLRYYLMECNDKGVGLSIEVAGKEIENEKELLLPLQEGDVTIFSVPAGSKSGAAKILAAVLIIYLAVTIGPGFGESLTAIMAGEAGVGAYATVIAVQMGVSLAMTGLQQIMAPDPSVDSDGPEAYLFNGSEQNVIEGDPVPVLYGELRVPGRPIAFSAISSSRVFGNWASIDIAQDPDKDGGVTTTTKGS
jgi:predicted phage tail protein